jgi:hypothetical protein
MGLQEGGADRMKCRAWLDIFWYPSSRRASRGRIRPLDKILGITNRVIVDCDGKREELYWVFGEADKDIDIKAIRAACSAIGAYPVLIFKTMKGWHVYTNLLLRSESYAYGVSRKLEKLIGGDGHKGKPLREKFWGHKFQVLRVGPKYPCWDLELEYYYYPDDPVIRAVAVERVWIHYMLRWENESRGIKPCSMPEGAKGD